MEKSLIGLGLRARHFDYLLRRPRTGIGWFEIITENFTDTGGAPLYVLEHIRKDYPVAFHGVALSIGSVDGVSQHHLKKIRALAERIEPFQISDHFCFSRYGRRQYHELLPLPRTLAMARRVIQNIQMAQDFLKRRLVFENISAYTEHPANEMSEAEFINTIATHSGCGVLLDINNLFVNATNFRFNARRALLAFDPQHVVQYHLAGFTDMKTHLLDTHAERVHAPVRRLFREARYHLGERRFSIERDEKIPSFGRLEQETTMLAGLTPARMPQRFLTQPVQYSHEPRITDVGNLKREQNWQRNFYTLPVLKKEKPAGFLTTKVARQVYRDAYYIRLAAALKDKFKTVAALLNDKEREQLFAAYIETAYSCQEDLSAYGSTLAGFLRKEFPQRPYLADAAKLDLLRYELFHLEVKPTKIAVLKKKVALYAARLWQSNYTILAPNGKLLPKTDAHKITKIPQFAIIYRVGFAVEQRLLSKAQYRFAAALRKPNRVQKLLREAEKNNQLTAPEVRALFRILGIAGVLA